MIKNIDKIIWQDDPSRNPLTNKRWSMLDMNGKVVLSNAGLSLFRQIISWFDDEIEPTWAKVMGDKLDREGLKIDFRINEEYYLGIPSELVRKFFVCALLSEGQK